MASEPQSSELSRAFAWMSEIGAEDALREQDAAKLAQAAQHAALLVEREALAGGPLWDEAGAQLLLDSWLSLRGVTRGELQAWGGGSETP